MSPLSAHLFPLHLYTQIEMASTEVLHQKRHELVLWICFDDPE